MSDSENVILLAGHLAVKSVDLSVMPDMILAQAMDELKFTLRQKAGLYTYVAQERNVHKDDLHSYLKERDNRSAFPWKLQEARAMLQVARMHESFAAKNAFQDLTEEFESQAKSGLLTPVEVLLGQYALYCKDVNFGRFAMMSLILRVPASSRIEVHNWQLAQDLPVATKEAYGTNISKLTFPLFPPTSNTLTAFNTKLLNEGIEGGAPGTTGTPGSILSKLFALSGTGLFGGTTSVVGGGMAPVGQLQDGSYAADTSNLEKDVHKQNAELKRQIKGMERKLAAFGAPPRQPQQQYQRGRGGYRGGLRGGALDPQPTSVEPPLDFHPVQ